MPTKKRISRILRVTGKGMNINEGEARELIRDTMAVFRHALTGAGFTRSSIGKLTTKLRDAGRRSPPWRPTSSRVPGRPQDGADGNRISRWLLPGNHKFYADEVTATMVEVRYFWQLLSMKNAPDLEHEELAAGVEWLLGHPLKPGEYLDPIQLIPIDLTRVAENPRILQSGHILPLDRGGRHEPSNAFLMLKSSNDLQGNLTVPELLDAMEDIIERHRAHDLGRLRKETIQEDEGLEKPQGEQ